MRTWIPRIVWSALPITLVGCLLPTSVPLGRNLPHDVHHEDPPLVDLDQDGQTEVEGDCDDTDDEIAFGFLEDCDGKDNDCDGTIDGSGAEGEDVCDAYDTFTQSLKTDVLLVVDNSYDMGSYWWLASQGASAMTAQLRGATSDTRIGVLFNDLENEKYSGNLVVPPGFGAGWIEGDDLRLTPTFVRNFFNRTLVYQQGASPDAHQGMRDAIEAAIQPESRSQVFFRPDASLNVVMITNREDGSVTDNAALLHDLADRVGSMARIRVYGVVQTDNVDCYNPTVDVVPATSMIALAQQTGGMYESVCMSDWTGFMTDIGQSIANNALRTTFSLAKPARQETVRVTIYPDDDSESYPWDTFALIDPQTLVFHGAPPPIGTVIRVDYLEDWRY